MLLVTVMCSRSFVMHCMTNIQGRNIFLRHKSTGHHPASFCMEKIQKNNWELLRHSPYSLDLAPLDYHLFSFIEDFT
jgi:hypothetical protein